jgi:hypothetical protein
VETVGYSQLSWGCGVRTGGLGVSMGSIGLREVRGVEAPETAEPDFPGVTVF